MSYIGQGRPEDRAETRAIEEVKGRSKPWKLRDESTGETVVIPTDSMPAPVMWTLCICALILTVSCGAGIIIAAGSLANIW